MSGDTIRVLSMLCLSFSILALECLSLRKESIYHSYFALLSFLPVWSSFHGDASSSVLGNHVSVSIMLSCQQHEELIGAELSPSVPGVANDRPRPSELPGGLPDDEKEHTSATATAASPVTSPVIGPVVQDLPSAAAQLGLVSPPEGTATPTVDDDDMVETGVVGWESFGEPPPGMPEEHASVVSTLLSPKAPIPPAPTTENLDAATRNIFALFSQLSHKIVHL